MLSTHVQQLQVQDAVKELDEADLAEGKAMTACGTEINSYDVAERVFHASMRRWNRAFDRKPPPDPNDQIEKYYKLQEKVLKAEVRMLQSMALAYRKGCDARNMRRIRHNPLSCMPSAAFWCRTRVKTVPREKK